MYVIGANWVYKGMWYLVSPFLAEKTRAKIVLVSADLHELTDQYETEQLTAEFGGTKTDVIYDPTLMWGLK